MWFQGFKAPPHLSAECWLNHRSDQEWEKARRAGLLGDPEQKLDYAREDVQFSSDYCYFTQHDFFDWILDKQLSEIDRAWGSGELVNVRTWNWTSA
jgi:hypothetical protein